MKQPISEETIMDVLYFLDENWAQFRNYMIDRGYTKEWVEKVYNELEDAVKEL